MAKKYTLDKSGYYKTTVWDGTYKDGKKHRVTIRSKKSSRDLERKVAEFNERVRDRKNIRGADITFLQYANTWLDVYKAGSSDNTKRMYRNIIDKHLCILNGIRLQDIDRIHLQQALNNAEGKKATQRQIRMTFRQVLTSAVTDHLFPANVAVEIMSNTENIRYRAEEKRPLTQNEVNALFKADLEPGDKVFVYLLYGCGIRRGEDLALTVFDINTKRRELTVNKSHALIDGNVIVKPPKTANGNRTVPIPDRIWPFVAEYVASLRQKGKIYLFTMQNGEPMTASSYEKMWKRIIKAMNAVAEEPIIGLTAHIFRHNYATALCYQIPKISIKNIARLVGDTEAVVIKIYDHIQMEKENAEEVISEAL